MSKIHSSLRLFMHGRHNDCCFFRLPTLKLLVNRLYISSYVNIQKQQNTKFVFHLSFIFRSIAYFSTLLHEALILICDCIMCSALIKLDHLLAHIIRKNWPGGWQRGSLCIKLMSEAVSGPGQVHQPLTALLIW